MCAASRLIYRTLLRALDRQRRSLDLRNTWSAQPGLRGIAAATNMVIELGDVEELILEWEDLLQRTEVHAAPISDLVRPFFSGGASQEANPMRDLIDGYPALSAKLGHANPIDRGFAALRLSSTYSDILEQVQVQVVERHNLFVEPTRKRRPATLLFACGDVCEHRFFGRCVVVGWDETCQQGESWIRKNRIRENLKFGTEQPFYNVLLERDEVPRYCSQENLALLPSPGIFAHPHAPFYFQQVTSQRGAFIPSEALAFVYPEDRAMASGERNFRSLEDAHDPSE